MTLDENYIVNGIYTHVTNKKEEFLTSKSGIWFERRHAQGASLYGLTTYKDMLFWLQIKPYQELPV
jgi:hypothetical protein